MAGRAREPRRAGMTDASDITVRQAERCHAPAIAAFNCALAMESEGRRLDAARVRDGVEGGLARPDICRYYVALAGGRVIGQLMITREWSDWRAGEFWWIQSVYVDPAWRGRGVFRRLYGHVESLARSTPGVCGLRLYVDRGNAAAEVYRRLGMRTTDYAVMEICWLE